MRKRLAGRLIRLAHRIYPPKVTEHPITFHGDPEIALTALQRLQKRQAMQWSR